MLDREGISPTDKLRTFTESIAEEIRLALPATKKKLHVLCTGGGAFNDFLITTLSAALHPATLTIPDTEIIKFKEALIFAFLGVLRLRGEPNSLKSVTGAKHDGCGGVLIGI